MNNDGKVLYFVIGYAVGLVAGFIATMKMVSRSRAAYKESPPTMVTLVGGPEDGREVLMPEQVPEYHVQAVDDDTRERSPTYIYRRTSPTTFQFRDKVSER